MRRNVIASSWAQYTASPVASRRKRPSIQRRARLPVVGNVRELYVAITRSSSSSIARVTSPSNWRT